MVNILKIYKLVFGLIFVAFASHNTYASNQASKLEFIISSDKTNYVLYEDINVAYTFTNDSNTSIEYYSPIMDIAFGGVVGGCFLSFEIRDQNGNIIPYTGEKARRKPPETCGCEIQSLEPKWSKSNTIKRLINYCYKLTEPGKYTVQGIYKHCPYSCEGETCPKYMQEILKSNIIEIEVLDTNKVYENIVATQLTSDGKTYAIEHRLSIYQLNGEEFAIYKYEKHDVNAPGDNKSKVILAEEVSPEPRPVMMVDYNGVLFMVAKRKSSGKGNEMISYERPGGMYNVPSGLFSTEDGYLRYRYDLFIKQGSDEEWKLEKTKEGYVYILLNMAGTGENISREPLSKIPREKGVTKKPKIKKGQKPEQEKPIEKKSQNTRKEQRSSGPVGYGEKINDLRMSLSTYYSIHLPWNLIALTVEIDNLSPDPNRSVFLEAGNPAKTYKVIITDEKGKEVNIPPEAWAYNPKPDISGENKKEEIKVFFSTYQTFIISGHYKVIKPGIYKVKIQRLDWKDEAGNPLTSNEVQIELLDFE